MDPQHTGTRVLHLEDCQFRDPQRGFFRVGVKACSNPRFHRGMRVYTDATGERFTIGEPVGILTKPIKAGLGDAELQRRIKASHTPVHV